MSAKKPTQSSTEPKAATRTQPDIPDDASEDGPVSSFQSYAAEGDLLAKQGEFHKAIEAYNKVIVGRYLNMIIEFSLGIEFES